MNYEQTKDGVYFNIDETRTVLFIQNTQDSKKTIIELCKISFKSISMLKSFIDEKAAPAINVFHARKNSNTDNIIEHYSEIFSLIVLMGKQAFIEHSIERNINDDELIGFLEATNCIVRHLTKKALISLADKHNNETDVTNKKMMQLTLAKPATSEEEFFIRAGRILNELDEEEELKNMFFYYSNFIKENFD